jgi:glycyl-tRNA synthetase
VLTMQDALLALTRYWTERGCMIAQPFNTEVGAGTLNPATVLRVLGPEPWHVAYVEPSVRPDDARYGQNPNRLQTHTQFQVILKPDPGNPQELYLGSLEALGIDIAAHDVRFVEDNWAAPAIASWGLGWEVWLDGLEITQFTYFQQAAGLTLDPVAVEITYGVERILMALQNVDHFTKIAYADGVSYGEVFGQSEYEMSRYYLDDADVETNLRLFEDFAAEARRCLDAGLPVPAHTFVLKCSHTFNVLDSRGAVSTTQRANAFARMRGLIREVSALWVARREELGHPLGLSAPPPAAPAPTAFPAVTEPATLLFEIGVEELPAAQVTRTAETVRSALTAGLATTRLTHGEISVVATPRRVVATVDAVAPVEPDSARTVRGPRVSAAFDAAGAPTKAAAGFARGQGVAVEALTRVVQGGTEHVAVEVTDTGRGATEALSGVLAGVVGELRADANMRWNDPKLSFIRPIRWVLALLGDVEVPLAVSTVSGGRLTRVHRTAPEPTITVARADGYLDLLAEHGIIADPARRRTLALAGARALAAEVGGTIDEAGEAALIEEIINLVERPTPIRGAFAESYLDLPAEILTTVMRKHQRYLPIRGDDGALLPYFVAVANGDVDADVVRAGNEAVLRARYEDALFFWRADLAVAPATMKDGLAALSFEQRLGSMADRAGRIAAVASALGGQDPVTLSPAEATTLARAGELAKFDLASQMVVELTSLAGTMAREYALRAGEDPAVATALYEMEQPRSAGAPTPVTLPGALLALADRLDLLAGLFAIGAQPTGSSDPFGLRRAALGAVAILRSHPALAGLSVRRGLELAAGALRGQGHAVSTEAVEAAAEFVRARFARQLLDARVDHRFVDALLPLADRPAALDAALADLTVLAGREDFAALAAALQRVRRIVPDGTPAQYDPAVLVEPAEIALSDMVGKVSDGARAARGFGELVEAIGPLVGPIGAFFDDVLVMADEDELRAARLGLLATIDDLAGARFDWRALGTDFA